MPFAGRSNTCFARARSVFSEGETDKESHELWAASRHKLRNEKHVIELFSLCSRCLQIIIQKTDKKEQL
jgi:hypothetical protein